MKKDKNKKSDEEISPDWFKKHKSVDEEELDDDNLEDEEVKEIIEKDEEFDRRVKHFLANQKKEVSLEKIIEVSTSPIEKNLPKKENKEELSKEKIDYLTGNKIGEMKYEVVEADTRFIKQDLSTSEKILERQKELYKHLRKFGGEMIGEKKSEWKAVAPEDTIEKDYLTKKKFWG